MNNETAEKCLAEILEILDKYNLPISRTFSRDEEIRAEYRRLKKEGKMSCRKAREFLADKHCTGIKNIEDILYMRGKKENARKTIGS